MVLVTWKSNELRIPDFVRAEEQEESVVAAEGLWFYLRVLRAFESIKSWDTITEKGITISRRWVELAKKHSLKIKIGELPALANFQIRSPNWLKYKSLITQEMLKSKFLAANMVYVSIEHTDEILANYLKLSERQIGRLHDKGLVSGPSADHD